MEDKMIWKIRRWIINDLPYLHKDLARGIKNLWKWFPLVWKDRDWDSHFIFETLKFKIENTAKYIKEKDRYVGCERDVEIMMTCVRLIEKIQDEYYDLEPMGYSEEKFTFKKIEGSESSELEIETISENYSDYFKKYSNVYRRALVSSRENKGWYYNQVSNKTLAMWMGNRNHVRAKKILFALMERNIEKWWD